jgi:hypothetical protein
VQISRLREWERLDLLSSFRREISNRSAGENWTVPRIASARASLGPNGRADVGRKSCSNVAEILAKSPELLKAARDVRSSRPAPPRPSTSQARSSIHLANSWRRRDANELTAVADEETDGAGRPGPAPDRSFSEKLRP